MRFIIFLLIFCSSSFADSITLSTADDIEDTYVYITTPTTNYSNTGGAVNAEDGGARKHIIYKFNLSAIPSNSTIDSVEFKMFKNLSGIAQQLFIYRITSDVVITECTWNIYSTSNDWTTAGGDFGAKLDSLTNQGFNGPSDGSDSIFVQRGVGFGLTNLIEDWVDGTHPNYGLLIQTDYTASSYPVFSIEQGPDLVHPRLYIEYTETSATVSQTIMVY